MNQQKADQQKPIPFIFKLMIKREKLYIQFLKGDPHHRTGQLLQARRYLKWLQDEVRKG